MRFTDTLIENFRGISRAHLTQLEDTIVIAGPNGCGKSSIFDAIRLWKSAYAGYQGDEIQSWLAEFGLSNNTKAFSQTLQSLTKPMTVQASIRLTESEKSWIRANSADLIRESTYRRVVPNYNQYSPYPMGMPGPRMRSPQLAESLRIHEPAVQQQIAIETPQLLAELAQDVLTGRLTCYPDGQAQTTNSIALARVFSIYDGINVGVIDYHGAHRTFAREEVGGISLQIEQYQTQRQTSALYNSANKYGGVKTELAVAYVRDLIAKSSGKPVTVAGLGLGETLDELFQRFFPGKKFRGVEPTADGSLKFEVDTPVGSHDINDLSSGEKELLYGYLRLRNYSPKNSIILLDEPELHLNPRLTDGLTDFYHRHVGKALNNQLWLLTHSDTILRQSVGRDNHKVYHMLTAGSPLAAPDQILEITADGEIEAAVIDLVGDLAAYKPGAKLVFIEGGGKSPFDEAMITSLFPEFASSVNLITSGQKARVRQVSSLLGHARSAGAAVGKAFAITDHDNEGEERDDGNCFRWDRYHIENYLLEPDFIAKCVIRLGLAKAVDVQDHAILALLKDSATDTLSDLVRHELEHRSHAELVKSLSASTTRGGEFDVSELRQALLASQQRISDLLNGALSDEQLKLDEQKVRARFQAALDSGAWIATFRGRDILKRFLSKCLKGCIRYDIFRNMIVSDMVDTAHKPEGMKAVLAEIEAG